MRTLLIDADILCYRLLSSLEKPYKMDDQNHVLHVNEEQAKEALEILISAYIEKMQADKIVFAFSDSENFRKSVYPSYKSNRKDTRKPMCFGALRDYITETYETKTLPTLEADDVLGILATGPWIKGEKIIVSIDKDFKQIPGLFYKPSRENVSEGIDDTVEILEISEKEADYYFLSQILTGDATDGYPGCPGVGPKTVEKIISQEASLQDNWNMILSQFKKKDLDESYALQMARCARILRFCDYDVKKRQVILWSPQ